MTEPYSEGSPSGRWPIPEPQVGKDLCSESRSKGNTAGGQLPAKEGWLQKKGVPVTLKAFSKLNFGSQPLGADSFPGLTGLWKLTCQVTQVIRPQVTTA